jgi:hypothetical protein
MSSGSKQSGSDLPKSSKDASEQSGASNKTGFQTSSSQASQGDTGGNTTTNTNITVEQKTQVQQVIKEAHQADQQDRRPDIRGLEYSSLDRAGTASTTGRPGRTAIRSRSLFSCSTTESSSSLIQPP